MDLNIWILSGWRGAGKTPICQSIAQGIQNAGFRVAGILSTAEYKAGKKERTWAKDILTGEQCLLISSTQLNTHEIQFGKWFIQAEGIRWGNQVLSSIEQCDLLIIDELGPLELELDHGWQSALSLIRRGNYKIALLVVRPELLEIAKVLFHPERIIEITRENDELAESEKLITEITHILKSIKV